MLSGIEPRHRTSSTAKSDLVLLQTRFSPRFGRKSPRHGLGDFSDDWDSSPPAGIAKTITITSTPLYSVAVWSDWVGRCLMEVMVMTVLRRARARSSCQAPAITSNHQELPTTLSDVAEFSGSRSSAHVCAAGPLAHGMHLRFRVRPSRARVYVGDRRGRFLVGVSSLRVWLRMAGGQSPHRAGHPIILFSNFFISMSHPR